MTRILCSLVLLGLLAPAVAVADQRPIATVTGAGCEERVVEVPADRARLQAALPAGWRLSNSPTFLQPSIYAYVAFCDALAVDGRAERPRTYAQLLTGATRPGSRAVAYVLRDFSEHAGYASAMRRAGFAGGTGKLTGGAALLPKTLPDHQPSFGGVEAGPAESFSLTIGATAPRAAVPGIVSDGFVFGASGPAGLAEYDITYTGQEINAGPGEITAPGGSYLAGLLGSTTAVGLGTTLTHDLRVAISAESPVL
jgi:hypothetical protein